MTNREYPGGSEWRKWDLHVHTPASIVHTYPGPDPWQSFLTGLENLAPEFKVIGINDYMFLDGYKRILEERKNGRIRNIDTVFPVIELRLNTFGGTIGHLSRVNYHVIFSNEIESEVIEQQFLSALSSKYVLTPQYDRFRTAGKWVAVGTRKSLEDLGALIIASVPQEERAKFGTPLVEGFNNLCLSLESIQSALQSHYLQGKYLTAVGKTEWADIKWNDHSIADKKTIINGTDLVFISAESAEACLHAKEALRVAEVNSRLLDCSDAHAPATAVTKDRLGKCFTWIKADPTFQGLRQVLYEPDSRLYLGKEPPLLARVADNATKYMSRASFSRTAAARDTVKWFSGSLPLNCGMIAIIGNKGSGKSALADILALLGNTKASAYFSFLNDDRFLSPKTRFGEMFHGATRWCSGREVERPLNALVDSTEPEQVKYIPQNYLEDICTELKDSSDTRFDRELMEVIFSHVSEADRLGTNTLSDLLEYITAEKLRRIALLTNELKRINEDLVSLEDQLTDEYRKGIQALLAQRRAEIQAHDRVKPVEVQEPKKDPKVQESAKTAAEELAVLQAELTSSEATIVVAQQALEHSARQIAAADRLLARIDNLEHQLNAFHADSSEDALLLDLDTSRLVEFGIDRRLIEEAKSTANDRNKSAKNALSTEISGSEAAHRAAILAQIELKRAKLDEPAKKYQEYLQALGQWTTKRVEIVGTPERNQSLNGLEARLVALDNIPAQLATRRGIRGQKALEIFETKRQLLADYQRLYRPVQEFIDKHPVSQQQGALQFAASIAVDGFSEGFLEMIHQGRKGSFQGDDDGRARVRQLVLAADFSSGSGLEAFLATVQEALERDNGDAEKPTVRLREQLRDGVTPEEVYDFLYGLTYLRPRFELTWQGKSLDQLSPGERGNLLLVFYLLIDKRDIPLLIDQPEENLDNQTIATTLVPAIRYAKESRQIIIVTHNPNLAVVCDADQIIHAQIDKADGNRMVYTCGSIENPKITRLIVDVLEGTKPAFDLRDARYEILERLS